MFIAGFFCTGSKVLDLPVLLSELQSSSAHGHSRCKCPSLHFQLPLRLRCTTAASLRYSGGTFNSPQEKAEAWECIALVFVPGVPLFFVTLLHSNYTVILPHRMQNMMVIYLGEATVS